MIHWHYWNCKTTPDDVFTWRQSGRNVESQASGVVIANRRFAAANGGRSRLWPVDETSVEIQVPEDSAPEAGRGGLEEKPAGERFLLQWLYDAAGNMTGKHLYNSQTALNSIKDVTYAYNYQDAMTEVRVANQVIASYQYDTNKQRIYSDTHYAGVDETKIYHWDMSGHIIGEETVPSDTSTPLNDRLGTTWYIYAGNNKIAMIRASGTSTGSVTEALYNFVNDLQGTPVLITDTSGNVVQKMQLDPYGNVERALGIFPDEINYTGKKLDQVTGLYYFNQRYYDPEIGRFLTHDPAHQRLNPYQYCDNNPLSNIDENGEFLDWLFAGLLKGVNKWWDNVKNGRGTSWDDFTNAVGQGMIDYGKEITGYAGLERGYNQFKSGLDNAIKGYTDALGMMNSVKLGLSLPNMGELNLGGLADVGKGIGSLAGTVSQINLSDIGNRMGTMAKGAVDVANKAVMAVPDGVYDTVSVTGLFVPGVGDAVSFGATGLSTWKTVLKMHTGQLTSRDKLGLFVSGKGFVTGLAAGRNSVAKLSIGVAYGSVNLLNDLLPQ